MTALPNPAMGRDQIVKLCPNKSAIDRVELWHDFSHERAGEGCFTTKHNDFWYTCTQIGAKIARPSIGFLAQLIGLMLTSESTFARDQAAAGS